MYTAFVPLHAKFAMTIYRIGQRYRSLNNIISTYAAAGKVYLMLINFVQKILMKSNFVSRSHLLFLSTLLTFASE